MSTTRLILDSYWDGGMKRRISNGIYNPKENRKLTYVTIADYSEEDKFTLNRWSYPLNDPWILKVSALLQGNNDIKEWMVRLKSIGYQYVTRTFEVKNLYERKLRIKIDVLIAGFLRKDGIRIIGDVCQIISRCIDCSIAIFRELYIESCPEPKLLNPPINELTAGYMKNDGIYIIGLHKLTSKYIDKVSGMYLKWDRTCSLLENESLGGEALEGDSEWIFEM